MARNIPLIKVPQWLAAWDQAKWAPDDNLPKPADHFFMGSMSLVMLRQLSGVSRRRLEDRKDGSADAGYQRSHEGERSTRISRYLTGGYPLSSAKGMRPEDHRDLIHPGWLPTAILVNILQPGATRRRQGEERRIAADETVSVHESKGIFSLVLPDKALSDSRSLEPFEIIDGQHRVFSVDSLEDLDEAYEVPVVFFHGLSTSWQAYLFWVINVEPKKINPSLAFDLYPELRSQSWLDRGEGIKIYQEHRAQEIAESLWRHPESPWRDRIELLGSRVEGHVSNAAFIRTLSVTFIRRWGADDRIGGLFGSTKGDGAERVLPWNRAQQIAFVIAMWREVADAAKASKAPWARACRSSYEDEDSAARKKQNPDNLDPSFAGPHTLLGTDQGVRAVSFVFNALCQVSYSEIGLEEWTVDGVSEGGATNEAIDFALASLRQQKNIISFLQSVARELLFGHLDWRTSKQPGLDNEGKLRQGVFRGSSGYKALQERTISYLRKSDVKRVSESAIQTASLLRIK